MITVALKCPQCGGDMNLEWDDALDGAQAERLAKGMVCTPCYLAKRGAATPKTVEWWRKLKAK